VSVPVFDAHCHLWIRRAPGVDGPALTDRIAARRELAAFRAAGGTGVVDCQPGGCGRDGRVLRRLAEASGVEVYPATGFHLERYYAAADSPYDAEPDELRERWARELADGLAEEPALRAGIVKSAWTGSRDEREVALMEAAATAAHAAGGALVVHTERGADAEGLAELLGRSPLAAERVQISHIDKRGDASLHLELARAGFRLGYDAFLRPKYRPQETTWPLIERLCDAGFADRITAGLDLADARMWSIAGGPGLAAIPRTILPRVRTVAGAEAAAAICGGNVRRLLSGSEVAA
jgi:phosphotriesterase-related protein